MLRSEDGIPNHVSRGAALPPGGALTRIYTKRASKEGASLVGVLVEDGEEVDGTTGNVCRKASGGSKVSIDAVGSEESLLNGPESSVRTKASRGAKNSSGILCGVTGGQIKAAVRVLGHEAIGKRRAEIRVSVDAANSLSAWDSRHNVSLSLGATKFLNLPEKVKTLINGLLGLGSSAELVELLHEHGCVLAHLLLDLINGDVLLVDLAHEDALLEVDAGAVLHLVVVRVVELGVGVVNLMAVDEVMVEAIRSTSDGVKAVAVLEHILGADGNPLVAVNVKDHDSALARLKGLIVALVEAGVTSGEVGHDVDKLEEGLERGLAVHLVATEGDDGVAAAVLVNAIGAVLEAGDCLRTAKHVILALIKHLGVEVEERLGHDVPEKGSERLASLKGTQFTRETEIQWSEG